MKERIELIKELDEKIKRLKEDIMSPFKIDSVTVSKRLDDLREGKKCPNE